MLCRWFEITLHRPGEHSCDALELRKFPTMKFCFWWESTAGFARNYLTLLKTLSLEAGSCGLNELI